MKGKRSDGASAPHHADDPEAKADEAKGDVGPEMITLDKDIFGNPYLPGAEITVVREVYEAAHAYESSKLDHAAVTKRLTEDKKKLAAASIKHRSHFESTKDGLHFVYPCAGVDVLVDRKEQISTKAESSAAPAKGKGKGKKKDDGVY